MKTRVIAVSLFAATAAAVVLFPDRPSIGAATTPPVLQQPPAALATSNAQPRVEVVFVLDTTGSMSGLIAAAKEKIWSIATTIAQAENVPEVRMGLVAYRDRGDDYVTRVVDLSTDIDSMYATLMELRADGGGDGPESVNAGLRDAVERMSWSQDGDTYRVVFLVGDAPPHMDYQDEPGYPEILRLAKTRGIVVNTIQSGVARTTEREWRHIATLGAGRYFQVGHDGNAVAIATPFDERLAELSSMLDDTRLYYGSADEMKEHQRKLEATARLKASGSAAALARRATFNATESGAANLVGEGDLVADVASGRVELEAVAPAALPAPMRAMAPAERKRELQKTATRRDELKRRINELAEQRSTFLAEKIAERGGAKDSLDRGIFEAVREQAATKGLLYDSDAVRY